MIYGKSRMIYFHLVKIWYNIRPFWDVREEIDFLGFLINIATTAISAGAAFLGCKLFSLLLQALAGIHANTRITAEIAKANAEKENKE